MKGGENMGIVKTLYFPLTIRLNEYCEDGYIDPYDAVELDGDFASSYKDVIEDAFFNYTKNDDWDMADFFDEDASAKEKITSMKWGFVLADDTLYGKVDVHLKEDLTVEEIESVKDYISGQNSDGLGEGFEQQEITIEEGEMAVSFWHSGNDYSIMTQEEFDDFIGTGGVQQCM